MARLPRVIVPGVPRHVTQRGNRRQPVFFQDADYREYLRLLGEQPAVRPPGLGVLSDDGLTFPRSLGQL